MTSIIQNTPFLKLALLGDAVASGAIGVLLAAGAPLLGDLLGFDAAFLRNAGLFLIPYALFVAFIGTRHPIPRMAVWVIIAANMIWTADSALLLTTGDATPTLLGNLFVTAQAIVVFGFGVAQFIGLRRSAVAQIGR